MVFAFYNIINFYRFFLMKDGSFFVYDLAIYIKIRNRRVAARALQGVTNKLDACVAERGLTFYAKKTSKPDIYKEK